MNQLEESSGCLHPFVQLNSLLNEVRDFASRNPLIPSFPSSCLFEKVEALKEDRNKRVSFMKNKDFEGYPFSKSFVAEGKRMSVPPMNLGQSKVSEKRPLKSRNNLLN